MVVDKVTSGGNLYLIGICLLWGEINNDTGIGDCYVLGDVGYLGVSHNKHQIGPLLTCFVVLLCHASKVLPKCGLLCLGSGWIMHESFIATDGFTSRRVDQRHGDLFHIKA